MTQSDFQATIEIEDKKFFEALSNPQGFIPHLVDAMDSILSVYEKVASEYAPESEANRPGRIDKDGSPMGYYERGRGWWYPVLTHNKLGLENELPILRPHTKSPKTLESTRLLARGFEGVAGYKLIPGSEKMHDQWDMGVGSNAKEVVGHLRNNASYSNVVQGTSQEPLHRTRGWQTVEQSWETPEVQDVVKEETAKAIEEYYNLGGS